MLHCCKTCEYFVSKQKALGYSSQLTAIKSIIHPKKVNTILCLKENADIFSKINICSDFKHREIEEVFFKNLKETSNNSLVLTDKRVLAIKRLKRRFARKRALIKKEVKSVVERMKQRERPPQIEGIVESVEKEISTFDDGEREQYHVLIKPTDQVGIDFVAGSKTERFHTWVGISPSTEEDSIVEGSNLDNFIQCVEAAIPDSKKLKTHKEVMNYIVGKKFIWVLKRLGRTYQGKESREVYVPQVFIKK